MTYMADTIVSVFNLVMICGWGHNVSLYCEGEATLRDERTSYTMNTDITDQSYMHACQLACPLLSLR